MVITTITHFRNLVRAKQYVVTAHAAEELEDDDLSILDLEHIVLTGVIIEWQHDQVTAENKHLIVGGTLHGFEAETVVKIGATGKLIFITVYAI